MQRTRLYLSRSGHVADLEVPEGQRPVVGDQPHPVVTRLFEDRPPDVPGHTHTPASLDGDAAWSCLQDDALLATVIEGNDLDEDILVDRGSSQGCQLEGDGKGQLTDRKAEGVYPIKESMQSDPAVVVHGVVGTE